MKTLSRRAFLERSLTAGAAALLAPSASLPAEERPAQGATGPGASERVRIAIVGARWTQYVPDHRGRGSEHVEGFAKMKDVEIAAICDVDERVIGESMKHVEAKTGKRPRYIKDFRKLLEDRSIDAVTIATPNQWHSLQTIWAVQAGKDVYVEKPISHTLWEGRKVVEAARSHDRLVQHGTQARSSPGLRKALDFLRSGKLGAVQVARGLCYKKRVSIGKKPDSTAPVEADYDLWLGPAPVRPFNENRFHYQWHWNWDYGNGDIGNQGIHEMDIARWGLGKTEPPAKAISLGGRFGYEDDGMTPNTQIALFDYGDSLLLFEVRGLPTADYKGARIGVVFHCSKGLLVCTESSARALDASGKFIESFNGEGDHFRNFIDAVKSRRRGDLAAEALEGHLSTTLVHLANVSYRKGQPQPLSRDDPFSRYGEGNEAFGRMRDHLRENGVALDRTLMTVGKLLEFDGKQERIAGDGEADRLLRREYRSPFVVPEIV
jgi:predicted dehydrogenase